MMLAYIIQTVKQPRVADLCCLARPRWPNGHVVVSFYSTDGKDERVTVFWVSKHTTKGLDFAVCFSWRNTTKAWWCVSITVSIVCHRYPPFLRRAAKKKNMTKALPCSGEKTHNKGVRRPFPRRVLGHGNGVAMFRTVLNMYFFLHSKDLLCGSICTPPVLITCQ
jgi:hypothetical protein